MAAIDVFGHALDDYLIGNTNAELILHNSYGEPELMPVEVFFREQEDLTALERAALMLCKGEVLDVGAGTGTISLIIQENLDVTALELSADACEIANYLGVKKIVNQDIWQYQAQKFDTLLMLMNGIGIVGELKQLGPFLLHLKTLLKPDGQILFDSSDLTYLHPDFKSNPSLGEILYQYEYKGNKSDWFNWLFVGEEILHEYAHRAGFKVEIVLRNDDDQYLAKLTLQS